VQSNKPNFTYMSHHVVDHHMSTALITSALTTEWCHHLTCVGSSVGTAPLRPSNIRKFVTRELQSVAELQGITASRFSC
jgi:hypothetical protein